LLLLKIAIQSPVRKSIIFCVTILFACNKTDEEVKPIPNITGEWEHLYFIFEDLKITEDSIILEFSSNEIYRQLNDSILIINNGTRERAVNYRFFDNGQLYYSFARSFNNNPLKYGQDSNIYEVYQKKL